MAGCNSNHCVAHKYAAQAVAVGAKHAQIEKACDGYDPRADLCALIHQSIMSCSHEAIETSGMETTATPDILPQPAVLVATAVTPEILPQPPVPVAHASAPSGTGVLSSAGSPHVTDTKSVEDHSSEGGTIPKQGP